jgi:hypothetical protein
MHNPCCSKLGMGWMIFGALGTWMSRPGIVTMPCQQQRTAVGRCMEPACSTWQLQSSTEPIRQRRLLNEMCHERLQFRSSEPCTLLSWPVGLEAEQCHQAPGVCMLQLIAHSISHLCCKERDLFPNNMVFGRGP